MSVVALGANPALASMTAYDHLIAASSTIAPPNVELAEYVTLATGPTTLDSARFRMSFSTVGSFSGTLWLSFYSDVSGTPGALLGSYSQAVIVSSVATFANFTGLGLNVPDSVWVSSQFVTSSTAGVRLTLAAPTVGGVSSTRATRAGGSGSWDLTPGVDRWMEMSLTAVPAPSTTGALAAPVLLAATRRRRS